MRGAGSQVPREAKQEFRGTEGRQSERPEGEPTAGLGSPPDYQDHRMLWASQGVNSPDHVLYPTLLPLGDLFQPSCDEGGAQWVKWEQQQEMWVEEQLG